MKAQISRKSFVPEKNYSGVYQQQGRMLTDADWNEMVDALKHRMNRTVGAAIQSGSPRVGGILDTLNPPPPDAPIGDPTARVPVAKLRRGPIYVNGNYAEIRSPGPAEVPINDYVAQQVDFPSNPAADGNLTPGHYILYADLWERLVLALEDDALLDAALHGADTCVRSQTVAQLKLWPWTSSADPSTWQAPSAKGTAKLSSSPASGTPPPTPSASRNALLRIEVHNVISSGSDLRVTLKWSAENGAEHYQNDDPAQAGATGPPPGFWSAEFVYDFFDRITEHHLGVHADFSAHGGWAPARSSLLSYTEVQTGRPVGGFVRRWDGRCTVVRNGAGEWALDDSDTIAPGTQLSIDGRRTLHLDLDWLDQRLSLELSRPSFDSNVFVVGDYWLAYVRDGVDPTSGAQGTVVKLLSDQPVGIDHHYLAIGFVEVTATSWSLGVTGAQLRQLSFPFLSQLTFDRIEYVPAPGDDPTIEGTLRAHRVELDAHEASLDGHDTRMDGIDAVLAAQEQQLAIAYGQFTPGVDLRDYYNVHPTPEALAAGRYKVKFLNPVNLNATVVCTARDLGTPHLVQGAIDMETTGTGDVYFITFQSWQLSSGAPAELSVEFSFAVFSNAPTT